MGYADNGASGTPRELPAGKPPLMVRPLLFVAVALAASWVALAGCNVSAVATDSTAGHPTVDAAYNPGMLDGSSGSDGATASWPGDAAVPNLCHLTSTAICNPDDPATSEGCRLAPDGGTYNPSAPTGYAPVSCHVPPGPSNSISLPPASPVCLPAGTGMDGASCKQSTDCAPRYECVSNGAYGTCRKYCCAGETACSGEQFCDVQPMAADSATIVPVCMPITPAGGCQLLEACPNPSTQTCAVVTESGATSCVDTGRGKALDPCDEQHCGPDLVCLGAPGQRFCYQLCHSNAMPSECPASRPTCKGGLPLFPDPAVGICQ
jgi:hypothetical protein